MQTLWNDLRYGARILLKRPALSMVAIVALALSIGANTAIFSAINALLLRPLPVEDIDRLVFSIALREGFDPFGSSFLEYAAYRDRNHSFVSSGVATQRSFNLLGQGEPEHVRGATVMADYLTTLGVEPVLGRTFSAQQDRPGGPPVALISYALWQRRFAGSPVALGQSLNLEGRSYNIIGVMPPGFDLPAAAEIWIPLQANIENLPLTQRAATNNEIVARLRPGVSLQQADAELKAIDRQLEQEYPAFRRGWSVKAISLRQELLGDLEGHVRSALFILMAGVGFLLLICCANVANLQLARGISRERELALRRALGAGRWRLVRQLLTESILLALLGGAAGLVLANWLLPILAALNPIRGISFAAFFHNFELDQHVLVFALFITLLTGVIFGLLPALKGAGADELMPRIKEGDQRTGGTVSSRRWFNALIVTEIAIALTLLVCGGLMVRSFHRLQYVDLGFKPDDLLTLKMVLPDSKYSQYRTRVALSDRGLERIRNLPGVIAAGTTTNIPLEREIAIDAIFNVEGRPPANPNEVPITSHRVVSGLSRDAWCYLGQGTVDRQKRSRRKSASGGCQSGIRAASLAGRRRHWQASAARSCRTNLSLDDRGRRRQRRKGVSVQLPYQSPGLVRALRAGRKQFSSQSRCPGECRSHNLNRGGPRHYSWRRSGSADLKDHDDERESKRRSRYRTFRRGLDGNARANGIIARSHRA